MGKRKIEKAKVIKKEGSIFELMFRDQKYWMSGKYIPVSGYHLLVVPIIMGVPIFDCPLYCKNFSTEEDMNQETSRIIDDFGGYI